LWANLPTGILHGNLYNPGHFTECVEFRHDEIQGQHCMVTSTANFTDSDKLSGTELTAKEKGLNLVRGICVPASCSVEKVIEYSNRKFEELKATKAICKTNDPISFKAIDIVAM
jgi:translation initiation factor IF-3